MWQKIKVLLKIIAIFIFVGSQCLAQGKMKIATDKNNYSYGDSIEVRVSISNDTDSSFSIWGSSTCIVRIGFNSVTFHTMCTADHSEFQFSPNSSRIWIWELKPSELGMPDKNGEQIIHAYGGRLSDSIIITAPKYYGGCLYLGYKLDISANEFNSLRDSLNATVLHIDTLNAVGCIIEKWQIKNYSIDSLVNVYSNDDRLLFIEVERPLQFKYETVTYVKTHTLLPEKYTLYQNYPNPFNPSTIIKYSIAEKSNVQLTLFDILGNEVATLVSEEKPKGNYEIEFDAGNLSSGIYFYQMRTSEFIQNKKMTLLR